MKYIDRSSKVPRYDPPTYDYIQRIIYIYSSSILRDRSANLANVPVMPFGSRLINVLATFCSARTPLRDDVFKQPNSPHHPRLPRPRPPPYNSFLTSQMDQDLSPHAGFFFLHRHGKQSRRAPFSLSI